MRWGTAAALAVLSAATSRCAYYNAMWSAERFAKQARRSEARGEESQARGFWLQAAVKAESVLTRHPRSRWADDALVLRLEALVRGGDCNLAIPYLAQARRVSLAEDLRARADLAAAQCALEAGRPGEAGDLLAAPLRSADPDDRSHAAFLAGRAASARGDVAGAIDHYARSAHPAAGPARVRALLATGRAAEALALLDSLGVQRLHEHDVMTLFADVGREASPTAASHALDRLLDRTRLPLATRWRLLLADGDRLLAARAVKPALVRYQAIAASDAEGTEGSIASVRTFFAAATQAESLAALEPVRVAARRYLSGTPRGPAAAEAQALVALLDQVAAPGEREAAEFQAAELARDSLRAGPLAGRLFIAFAQRRPASLFAPKAVVAALPLLPELSDSLLAVLQERYAASPYTVALRGEISPAYAAAEDSLAQDLGVQPRDAVIAYRSALAPPVPGMRGPWLDQIFPTLGGSGPAAADVEDEPRGRLRPQPPRRRPGERPGERPLPTERP
ncbi:MAG: hypothetical protein HYS40_05255 [Gemmatimonadetes bacterium]|nr:hypothetical protein [Gemmatimonadota bacterium]